MFRSPASLPPLYTSRLEEKGEDWDRLWAGGPLGRSRREWRTDKSKEINI